MGTVDDTLTPDTRGSVELLLSRIRPERLRVMGSWTTSLAP